MADGDSLAVIAGVIAAASDPPGLPREGWRALVDASPSLRAEDGDVAEVVVDGVVVGRLRWSTSANELEVYGELSAVRDPAWNVAAALGGRFVTLAELTSC